MAPLNTDISHTRVAFDSKGGVVTVGSGYTWQQEADGRPRVRCASQVACRVTANGALEWMKVYSPVVSRNTWVTIDSVLLDGSDNTYAAGTLSCPAQSPGPHFELVLQKLDPQGHQLWAARFGAEGFVNTLTGMALDGNGGVIVTCTSQGPASLPTITTLRYDASGQLLWASTHLSANSETSWAIAADRTGGVYVLGLAHSGLARVPVILHYAGNGALLWETRLASAGLAASPVTAAGIVSDRLGACYLCANELDGGHGYTLVKIDTSGRTLWRFAQYAPAGAPGKLVASSIALDTRGGIAVAATQYNGPSAYIISDFRPDGARRFVTSVPADPGEQLVSSCVGVDGNGNSYVTGLSISAANFVYRQETVKLDPSGNYVWRFDNGGVNGMNPYLDFPSLAIGKAQRLAISGVTGHADPNTDTLLFDPLTTLLR